MYLRQPAAGRRTQLSRRLRRVLAVTVLTTLPAAGCQSPSRALPNVILVVVDTARADHFSSYGYRHPTTPHLDRFSDDALRFDNAYAVSSWTVPSHASLFTGLHPYEHGATQENVHLDDRFETLAELLAGEGYTTAAFSNNPQVSMGTNLLQGFDHAGEMWRKHWNERTRPEDHPTNLAVRAWLRKRDQRKPFFLFINYIEPHFPYNSAPLRYLAPFLPPGRAPIDKKRASFRWTQWYTTLSRPADVLLAIRTAMYDAELAYADAVAGSLIEEIVRLGLYDSSLIIVTSDHGENLGDHGHQDHVFNLYEAVIRVPLFVRSPEGRKGVRHEPVQLVDVFTTIARAAGVKKLEHGQPSYDLLSEPIPRDRTILAEYYYPRQALAVFPKRLRSTPRLDRFRRRLRSLRRGDTKLIWASDGKHELYDLGDDPAEQHDLFSSAPERAASLERELESLSSASESATKEPREAQLDPETRQRLRELGYAD